MNTHIVRSIGLFFSMAILVTFSSCNILGSSDSGELLISIEGQTFEVDDTVAVQITNSYNHNIFVHNQSRWSQQQRINNEWKTIYSPIADHGPARYTLFLEAGEMKVFKYPALPSSSLFESGYNELRYRFALFHNQDSSSPLPEKQIVTPSYFISIN